MVETIFKFLTPEQLQVIGVAAGLLLVIGVVLWLTGIRTARPMAAIAMTGAGFTGAYFVAPALVNLAPLTCGLIGAAAGLLAGVLLFRILQAAVLAAFVAVAAGGLYYIYCPKVMPEDNLLNVAVFPADQQATRMSQFQGFLLAQYQKIPPAEQRNLLLVAGGAAFVALAIGLGLPRATTLLGTALVGAFAVLVALHVLAHQYLGGLGQIFPENRSAKLLAVGVLALIGVAVQYRFFARKADKSSQEPSAAGATLRPV